MSLAEGERGAVEQQLQDKKQSLVQNYVREQQKLYAQILPEVQPGLQASVISKAPLTFAAQLSGDCLHAYLLLV